MNKYNFPGGISKKHHLLLISLSFLLFFPCATAQPLKFRSGIFLHHSTGGCIWGPNGGSTSIPEEIVKYNNEHGYTGSDSVTMNEDGWPVDPWDNEWYRWHQIFDNQDATADILPYLASNLIIVIKSCFPSSSMSGEGESADTLNPTEKTIYNYKWHWRNIVRVMQEHPDNFFVIWTNAPLVSGATNDDEANRSDRFCRWAKDTLAGGNDPEVGAFPTNVYVFDFFHKLVGSDGKLRPQYAASTTDSHPNGSATDLVAPQFVREIFDAAISYEEGEDTVPPVPILASPPDGALNQSRTPLLRWNGAEHAVTYHLQVSADSMFGSVEYTDSTLTDTIKLSEPLADSAKYFWRVRAKNNAGVSDWSAVWKFITAPPHAGLFHVMARWNLLSLPGNAVDPRVEILFPTAISEALTYESTSGYISTDSLIHGVAYWVKFGYDQEVILNTDSITADTMSTVEGWNMIGSITSPVPVAGITSIPGGISTSEFFYYNGRYTVSDTIKPGAGYWVKVAGDCRLILSSGLQSDRSISRIHIIPGNEMPPSLPSRGNDQFASGETTPDEFALSQNYPNPFNPSTTIRFDIPISSFVTLKVYNIVGQEVATLVNEKREAGRYKIDFNASNLASGMYFYRLTGDNFVSALKFILVR